MSGEGESAKGPGRAPSPLKEDPDVGREVYPSPGGDNHSPRFRLKGSQPERQALLHGHLGRSRGSEKRSNLPRVTQQAGGGVRFSMPASRPRALV